MGGVMGATALSLDSNRERLAVGHGSAAGTGLPPRSLPSPHRALTMTASGCSAVGSAPRSGRGGPGFESRHPDHTLIRRTDQTAPNSAEGVLTREAPPEAAMLRGVLERRRLPVSRQRSRATPSLVRSGRAAGEFLTFHFAADGA